MNIIEVLGIITWVGSGQLRPMKNVLREYLFQGRKARVLLLSARALTRCLSSVSHSIGYRLTVVVGAVRYDKDGQPCGTVTLEEEADSVQ